MPATYVQNTSLFSCLVANPLGPIADIVCFLVSGLIFRLDLWLHTARGEPGRGEIRMDFPGPGKAWVGDAGITGVVILSPPCIMFVGMCVEYGQCNSHVDTPLPSTWGHKESIPCLYLSLICDLWHRIPSGSDRVSLFCLSEWGLPTPAVLWLSRKRCRWLQQANRSVFSCIPAPTSMVGVKQPPELLCVFSYGRLVEFEEGDIQRKEAAAVGRGLFSALDSGAADSSTAWSDVQL